jgi:hypothetical protein
MDNIGKLLAAILFGTLLFSCSEKHKKESEVDQLFEHVKQKHGSGLIDQRDISFKFREHEYIQKIEDNRIVKYRILQDSNGVTQDMWISSEPYFERKINEETVDLSDSISEAYQNSINSVFYFSFLPLFLTDNAVNAEIMDTVNIGTEPYCKIKITFDQEGGGKDFEDIYLYWIHMNNKTLDYLAYKYFTNDGGIRFRKAYNRRTIGGITFQDYMNYKPKDPDLPFMEIDDAYNRREIIEVSKIVNENIQVSKPQK